MWYEKLGEEESECSLKCLRSSVAVSRMDTVTNEEVLRRAGIEVSWQ